MSIGNWKLQVENVLDSYHVPFSHASTVNRRASSSPAAKATARAPPWSNREEADAASDGRSARATSPATGTAGPATPRSTTAALEPGLRRYKRVLADKVGAERAREILTPRLHNSLVYPNVSIMGLNIHVRVIKPIAVDRTEVTIYPIRLVGAPAAMNFRNIRLLNVTHSAASFVQTDDLESFMRAQKGLRSHVPTGSTSRAGLATRSRTASSTPRAALATHEMVVRAQYTAWLGYMREAA